MANGIKIQNVYMTFGGTSWGWLPASVVYTSYDYGAAISEARQLTAKIPAMKEMGYFLRSVTDIAKVSPATAVAASNTSVKTYHLANPDTGTQFYFARNDHTADLTFTLPVTTPDGSYTVPQTGTLQLNGKDMKVLVAAYSMDSAHLVYTTSHLMTHAPVGDQDVALLASRPGDDGETVLRYPAAATGPAVTVLAGSPVTSSWNPATGDLLLSYTHSGVTQVRVDPGGRGRPLLLVVIDDIAAATFWRLDTSAGPVIVSGPELVRTAALRGSLLELTGDTTAAAPLEVWGPRKAGALFWNGRPVATSRTSAGSIAARSPLGAPPALTLPVIGRLEARDREPGGRARLRRQRLGRRPARPHRAAPPLCRSASRCSSSTTTASITATSGTGARGPPRPAPRRSPSATRPARPGCSWPGWTGRSSGRARCRCRRPAS